MGIVQTSRGSPVTFIASGIKQCLTAPDGAHSLATNAMEKLFLSLA